MWNAQSSGRWSPHHMFLDWFGLYGSQRDRLERSCWLSTLMKDWGIMGWIKSRRDCINVSPASLCILDECFRLGYIMGKWWAVACEYWLINRCTAGVMTFFPHFINFSHVRANSARMLLCSALTQRQVWIWQTDFQHVWIIIEAMVDVSRCWMDNIVKCATTERQRFVVF